jgi:hypothetical protein
MTRTSVYNRILLTVTLLLLIAHSYDAHFKLNILKDQLVSNQKHAIRAFAVLNSSIASSILIRAQDQRDKNDRNDKARMDEPTPTPKPTATPRVVIKEVIKYRKRAPTPRPFHLFGPN